MKKTAHKSFLFLKKKKLAKYKLNIHYQLCIAQLETLSFYLMTLVRFHRFHQK